MKKRNRNMKKKNRKRVPKVHKKTSPKKLEAPIDMCLLGTGIKDVLAFFRAIKCKDNWGSTRTGKSKVEASLKKVEKIDYAAISVLTTIAENFKKDKIVLSFTNSENRDVRKKLFFSGMTNHFYNEFGKKTNVSVRGGLINLRDGCGILKVSEMQLVMESLKNMLLKIGFSQDNVKPLLKSMRSVIMEICGNAIEWGYNKKEKKWILGIYRENDCELIITFTDIGDGILKTLNRKTHDVILDMMKLNDSVDILKNAFEKKYGSSTKEPNRNRGLPMIKQKIMQLKDSDLFVLTNDVLVNFSNLGLSKNLKDLHAHFHGTFYQWRIKNYANKSV